MADRRRVKIRLSDPGTVHRGLEPVPDPSALRRLDAPGCPALNVQATVQGSRVPLAAARAAARRGSLRARL